MLRRFTSRCALATVLFVGWLQAGPAAAVSGPVFTGSATGSVITVSGNSFTIQTPGQPIGVVSALTAAANRITKRDYPYVYGGGHGQAGVASVGIKGPGHNGRRIGFDCSGSVAAVLSAGGLWPAGSGVPSDAGIIATLRGQHLIARGIGKGPVEVTLYDHPGVHIFMNIDGRFFGTSDGAGGGNRRGGAGWLDDGAPDASSRAYKPWHFLPSVLHASVSSGHIISFQVGGLGSEVAGLEIGETVEVSYQESASGVIVATTLTFPGALTANGTVSTIAADGSSFTIQDPTGASLTFSTVGDPALVGGLNVGDRVEVTYTASAGVVTARAVSDSGPSGSSPAAPSGASLDG